MAFDITNTLETEICCNCGVAFALPASLQVVLLRRGQMFYCPNGHGQHYTDTVEKKLKRAEEEIVRQQQLRAEAERRETKTLGTLMKLQKRVKRGVCPCCQRTVSQMARHMKTKHPDYGKDVPATAAKPSQQEN